MTFIHSRSAYGSGSQCLRGECLPKSEAYRTCESTYLIYRFILYNPAVQVVLSTAHPARFSKAVTKALSTSQGLEFERDVLPQEFRGLLGKESRGCRRTKEGAGQKVIESKVGSADNGV